MNGGGRGAVDAVAREGWPRRGGVQRNRRPPPLPAAEPHRVFTISTGAVVVAHASPAAIEQAKCSSGPSCGSSRGKWKKEGGAVRGGGRLAAAPAGAQHGRVEAVGAGGQHRPPCKPPATPRLDAACCGGVAQQRVFGVVIHGQLQPWKQNRNNGVGDTPQPVLTIPARQTRHARLDHLRRREDGGAQRGGPDSPVQRRQTALAPAGDERRGQEGEAGSQPARHASRLLCLAHSSLT